ncbi:MAG: hypothetical protein ACI8QS_001701 [Planctomycetota bacterium]|jgi:hypothetical protein
MSFTRFQEIVRLMAGADTWDRSGQREAEEMICELREIVTPIRKADLIGLVNGASHIVHLAPKLDPIEAEDCQRMAVRLVQISLRRLHALKNARKKDLAKKRSGAEKAGPRTGMAIGDVLIQMGFITPEDLEQALSRSGINGRMLGQNLVELGLCEAEDVARAVFLQKSLQPTESKPDDGATKQGGSMGAGEKQQEGVDGLDDLLLGEALLRRGWVNPEELLSALRLHKANGVRIGDALIYLGYADAGQVQQALAWQTEMRAASASKQAIPNAYGGKFPRAKPAQAESPIEEPASLRVVADAHTGIALNDDSPPAPLPRKDEPTRSIRLNYDDPPA